MNYGTVETDVVLRLAAISNVDTVVMPDNESDFSLPTTRGKITVAVDGTNPDPGRSTGVGESQSEKITVRIVIQAKRRVGTSGVYAIQEAVVARLLGYRPQHCDKMMLGAFSYLDHKEGVWSYSQIFTTTTLRVELPDDESLVIASKITLEYNDETIVVETQNS